jgi:hypothetical protein
MLEVFDVKKIRDDKLASELCKLEFAHKPSDVTSKKTITYVQKSVLGTFQEMWIVTNPEIFCDSGENVNNFSFAFDSFILCCHPSVDKKKVFYNLFS